MRTFLLLLLLITAIRFGVATCSAGDEIKRNPASLYSLIASGKAKIETDDPAEIARLKKIVAKRSREVLSARIITQKEELLRSHFQISASMKNHTSMVVEVFSDGVLVTQGTLIDPKNGKIIVPLGQIEAVQGPYKVSHLGKFYQVRKGIPLSRKDNLALLEIPLPAGTAMSYRKISPIPVGTLLGSPVGKNKWITGTISSTVHSVKKYEANTSANWFEDVLNQHWKRIGLNVSPPHPAGYAAVYSCDLPISPEHCGSPVFDLSGHFIGIAIARADLHLTYLIPHKRIQELLKNTMAQNPTSTGSSNIGKNLPLTTSPLGTAGTPRNKTSPGSLLKSKYQ